MPIVHSAAKDERERKGTHFAPDPRGDFFLGKLRMGERKRGEYIKE